MDVSGISQAKLQQMILDSMTTEKKLVTLSTHYIHYYIHVYYITICILYYYYMCIILLYVYYITIYMCIILLYVYYITICVLYYYIHVYYITIYMCIILLYVYYITILCVLYYYMCIIFQLHKLYLVRQNCAGILLCDGVW